VHISLFTIYLLAVGTLLAGAAMTFWEGSARPEHRPVLTLWASGYIALAIGCLLAGGRSYLPGVTGLALSGLTILAGYLLILEGAATLGGRRHRAASIGVLAVLGVIWAIGGSRWSDAIWSYVSAVPVAVATGLTGWELMRNERLRRLRSRRVAIGITWFHALIYLGRAFALPVLAAIYGPDAVATAGKLTMYAAVIYSVLLPMALLALLREEAQERLIKLALTDELTDLGNRRWFFEQGTRLIASSRGSLSLLAFDIDHFKSINDRYGHATGDEVLKSFAGILRGAAGPDAIVARVGGEEFAVMLPECSSEQAHWIGQAVVSRFADTSVLSCDGMAVHTTVSVGLAETDSPHADLTSLLRMADRALYAAKDLGRNRVELAQPDVLAVA
jgi:diguanylate cyclase (GGDEF)-like protein